jgi:osmotically-inducible protein OsmY
MVTQPERRITMSLYDTIVQQIEQSLMADERTRDANIEVVNQRGVVTLSGKVESESIASAAEEIAQNQSGVIKVVNSLMIQDEEGSFEGTAPNPNRMAQ